MNNIQLMSLILNQDEGFNKYRLTSRQIQLVNTLKNRSITSGQLSIMYSTTVVNASAHLSNLYKKGYLVRSAIVDPTGGFIFEYRTHPKLINEHQSTESENSQIKKLIRENKKLKEVITKINGLTMRSIYD